MRTPRNLLLPALGVVCLSLVACGGSTDDSAGSAGASASAGAGGAGAGGAGAGGAGAGGAGAGGAGAGGAGAAGGGGGSGGAATGGNAGAGPGGGAGAGGSPGGFGGAPAGAGGVGGSGPGGAGPGGAGGASGGTITPISPVPASGATSLVYMTPNAGSWQLTAFDIDGKATTKASTDHCALVAGSNASDVMNDGPGGVDNSFGKNVAPIFAALDSAFFETSDQAIVSGGDTVAFLPLSPGSAPSSFPIALFQANGANIANPDTWKAHASEVSSVSPLLVGAKFPAATKVGAAFTSGVTGDVVHLPLALGGMTMRLDVHGARMTLTYAPDGTTKGVLGGWLETAAFTAEFKKLAGAISSGFCSGSALQGVTEQLEQASDILSDGTQAPEKTCNAITIGIGITTRPGTVDGVFTPAPATDPCAAE